ncbi:MAG TPA: nicotinamide riboside transporter PnuC [Luteibacter sp.]|jgi:nicotinamide mononucleotide transporter|nr:nicotinamide riboside transporter PnuC [Luteibacter sp.]
MSPLEILANAMATASILLAGRNSVHTWWTGIIGCAVFTVVFYDAHLYADAVLQVFFVIASIVGWWEWLHGDHGAPLHVRRLPARTLLLPALAAIVGSVGYGLLLHRYTQAYAPFADSTVLAFSILAQLLLMRRRLDTWPFWLLVNTIAVPLYASRGLYLTSALYLAYWINALVAWRAWRKLATEQA